MFSHSAGAGMSTEVRLAANLSLRGEPMALGPPNCKKVGGSRPIKLAIYYPGGNPKVLACFHYVFRSETELVCSQSNQIGHSDGPRL